MFLTTFENVSAPTCQAVELALLTVQPSSQEFRNANLAAGLFLIVLSWILLPLVWMLRDHRNFQKVRPLWISVALTIFANAYACSFMLRLYIPDDFPCAVLSIGFGFTMQGVGCVCILRALVFVVEGAIQKRMREERIRLSTDDKFDDFNPPTTTALRAIMKVGLGLGRIEDLSLSDLIQVKHPGFLILFVSSFFLIGFVVFVILFAVHPALLICLGCVPFGELIICVLVLNTPQAVVFARIAMVGKQYGLASTVTGVLQETIAIAFTSVPAALLGMILMIVNPGNAEYTNAFAWEWLILISGISLQLFCLLIPAADALRDKFCSRRMRSGSSQRDLLEALLNPLNEAGKEFELYASQNFVVELVHFLQDTAVYTRFGNEKGNAWRLQKARILCNAFIKVGADAEVNISDVIRQRILETLHRAEQGDQAAIESLDTIFDEAVQDVKRITQFGVLPGFIKRYPRDSLLEIDRSLRVSPL